MKTIIPFLLCTLWCLNSSAQLVLKAKEPPSEMKTLSFLIGKWKNAESQWYDRKGKPLKIERGKGAPKEGQRDFEISPIMGGLYLEGGAESQAVRSYFFYRELEKKYYHLAVDFMGSMSLMSGNWKGDPLIFTDIVPQAQKNGKPIQWRRKFFDLRDNAYTFTYEYAQDNGKSWKLRGRQTMERVTTATPHPIPQWLLDNWESRARGSGTWITDNAKYRSETEPYDAYGMQWEYGLGKKHLKGRLYAIQDNEDVGTIWNFTEFWSPASNEVRIVQLGSDGTVGQGTLWQMENGRIKERQTFVSPNGNSFETGHEAWMENGAQHTQSFTIVNEEWQKRRFYSWNRKEKQGDLSIPDEYQDLAFLIGEWQSEFGDRKARMTFGWGKNKRNIHFQNHYLPGKDQPWVQENEGLISYHGVKDKLVFITSYAKESSHLMAEGVYEVINDGTILRQFTCHYKAGDKLPWSGGSVAPPGGKSIKFKQVWTPVDDDTFRGEFYWQKNGQWEHPFEKEGFEEIWKKRTN